MGWLKTFFISVVQNAVDAWKNNYVLPAGTASPFTLFWKPYSDSSSWVAFHLLRECSTGTNVIWHMSDVCSDNFKFSIKLLHIVQPTATMTQLQCLVDKVFERYHDGENYCKALCFSSGLNWKSLWVSSCVWYFQTWDVYFQSLPVFQQLCIWLTVLQLYAANLRHDSGQLFVVPCWRHDSKYSLTLQPWRLMRRAQRHWKEHALLVHFGQVDFSRKTVVFCRYLRFCFWEMCYFCF